ncbi:MAG: 6-phosphofructokinase [Calditrichaeota bacterium]|nr:6-phosphofructokinase [Calditrichota bacterium]
MSTMVAPKNRLGIVVAGGPSPGINSVISAAAIRSLVDGVPVVGIQDGFKWIMRGDIEHTLDLTVDHVSRIHFTGGSILGTARDNPTRDPALLEATVNSLLRLNIDKLVTIGGDDTAFTAMKVAESGHSRIRVVHVPKTIDNDLDLPQGISTFGFQTARQIGYDIVKNLMVDARTTSRWFFVVAMGRKAGHLAMHISKASGNTLTLIPEEFAGFDLTMHRLVDVLAGAIVKRLAYGHPDGVAILAEGLLDKVPIAELEALGHVERDAHDNVRFDEIDFGTILKREVQKRLAGFGLKPVIVAKNLGYELRCADPIAFDVEYTRDLGDRAADELLSGSGDLMVSIQNGRYLPIPFSDMLDPETGRTRVRFVDIGGDAYRILQNFMIRLVRSDFDDTTELAKLAAVCGVSLDRFTAEFGHAVG